MNARLKLFIAALMCSFACYNLQAQSNTSTSAKKTKPVVKTAIPGAGNSTSVVIHNLCEKSLSVFAGSKSLLKTPKPNLTTCGGLSSNTVNIKVADVVCIMDAKLVPVACTNVRQETKTVEINASGKTLVAK